MKITGTLVLLIVLLTNCTDKGTLYDARIQEKEILTPAPAKSPRINGPSIYGVGSGKNFLYRMHGRCWIPVYRNR